MQCLRCSCLVGQSFNGNSLLPEQCWHKVQPDRQQTHSLDISRRYLHIEWCLFIVAEIKACAVLSLKRSIEVASVPLAMLLLSARKAHPEHHCIVDLLHACLYERNLGYLVPAGHEANMHTTMAALSLGEHSLSKETMPTLHLPEDSSCCQSS